MNLPKLTIIFVMVCVFYSSVSLIGVCVLLSLLGLGGLGAANTQGTPVKFEVLCAINSISFHGLHSIPMVFVPFPSL